MESKRHIQTSHDFGISSTAARLAGYWGVIGFALILGQSLFRFYGSISQILGGSLSSGQIVGILISVVLFAVGKGYFILQKSFAPRFAGRVAQLAKGPTTRLHAVLAPVYCLGLIGSDRKSMTRGYLIVLAVVLMILGARQLPDSWRAATMIGVAVALAWGLLATVVQSFARLSRRNEKAGFATLGFDEPSMVTEEVPAHGQ